MLLVKQNLASAAPRLYRFDFKCLIVFAPARVVRYRTLIVRHRTIAGPGRMRYSGNKEYVWNGAM